ncbi:MAG: DUF1015 domain-containing protein [Anaerolineae bacterium]|jgi:uncharacterized protein (DUF1015 family)|nr:DUF1015 domain-containing protein [Anaerolineae bacterium]MBT4311582.1 DUF1015 domain-containing protein [Anaerolineae bacterium]MBT4459103.1 DUF1015 domain-containing protein [Anaerolineae bacterium]MBT4840934.1 DUF1015 domain-containing protein [Anaerolineae bacterium]MBT6060696.1 DUF1015 domain-containing protein [Anaerolineae bacterium]
MANLKPFKGIRYNPEKVGDIATVISQPYDRVRHGLQEKYYALNDFNVTRMIKGKEFETDNDTENVYTRAQAFLKKWLAEGVLQKEEKPALYVYHQDFMLNGKSVTRKAIISALELARFEEGIVLPHERTHDGPKMDRLNLTRATEAYYGNIFILYPDAENKIDTILDAAIQRDPDVDVRELFEKDVRQKMWVVTDEEVIAAVQAEMAPKKGLIIADGHHRYETAIAYREEQRAKFPDAPADAAFNYLMVALVSMSNPGLTILPTHRLIFDYDKMSADVVLTKAAEYFEIEKVDGRTALEAKMDSAIGQMGCFGIATQSGEYALELKSTSVMETLAPSRADIWQTLDASILHKLLLEHILGISAEKIDAKEGIEYLREPDLGYERVANEETALLFIVNATRMEQIEACTALDEKMPQKSTDFYPKVISGLAVLDVGSDERF